MIDISDPVVISALAALMAVLVGYALFVPRNNDTFSPEILGDTGKNNAGIRLATRLGGEVYAALPQGMGFKNGKRDRIESLLIRSGNPWRMTGDEFYFFQFVCAFLGFAASFPVYFLVSQGLSLPWIAVAIACTAFGFFIPRIKYNDQAKKRDLDFKRQLPDALALINISLSSGVPFARALSDSIPNMREGVLKEEFKEILRQIDTGKTVSQALDHFSTRAPNESIRTFINAVKEANDLNVPLEDVLEQRAQESRAEFFALLHAKTAGLGSRIMGALTPTMMAALMLIILGPVVNSLMSSLG